MFGMFKKKPTINSIQMLELRQEHRTPDIAQLEQHQFQLLFVYNDLMKSHQHSDILDESKFLGHAYTEEPYALFKKALGKESFPVMFRDQSLVESFKIGGIREVVEDHVKRRYKYVKGKQALEKLPVRGELYAVEPSLFLELDKHHENGLSYRRKRVKLVYPYKEVPVQHGRELGHDSLAPKPEEHLERIEAWTYFGRSSEHPLAIPGLYAPCKSYAPRDNRMWCSRYYYFSTKELNDIV